LSPSDFGALMIPASLYPVEWMALPTCAGIASLLAPEGGGLSLHAYEAGGSRLLLWSSTGGAIPNPRASRVFLCVMAPPLARIAPDDAPDDAIRGPALLTGIRGPLTGLDVDQVPDVVDLAATGAMPDLRSATWLWGGPGPTGPRVRGVPRARCGPPPRR
jgi:hypothetical protein